MKPPVLCGVVLAGGSGTRLWPLSRLQSPKQFARLMGDETLLGATVARLSPMVDASRILLVTSVETASGEGYQHLEAFDKILEPVARNTAAAIGVAAVRFQVLGIDPLMVVLPSDHLIRDKTAFQEALRLAVSAAERGKLVTFGITPTHAETGFGYMDVDGDGPVHAVRSFREKPDRATAEKYLASGRHFWNSGIFVWKASVILRELGYYQPQLAAVLEDIRKASSDLVSFDAAICSEFARAPSISIDHGVLEKSANVVMVKGIFDWSDVGTWDAVFEQSDKDANRNVLKGNVVAIDSHGTLVRSQSRLVAVVGVDDVSVVETRDAILVARRGQGQRVGEVVKELARRGNATEHLHHTTVQRPWGSYTVVEEGHGFKIKTIEVRPGGRLSLQRHRHRSEHWVVVSGEATITAEERVAKLMPNESTFIPAGTKHRLENLGLAPLHIIEVQVGSYVGEDDIERFDDQYGRA